MINGFINGTRKTYEHVTNIHQKSPCVPVKIQYTTKLIDRIYLNAFMNKNRNLGILKGEDAGSVKLAKICYQYNSNVGKQIFNYNRFLRNLTLNKCLQILKSDCICGKTAAKYIDPHYNHIITGDSSILSDNKVLSSMISNGANFRLNKNFITNKRNSKHY